MLPRVCSVFAESVQKYTTLFPTRSIEVCVPSLLNRVLGLSNVTLRVHNVDVTIDGVRHSHDRYDESRKKGSTISHHGYIPALQDRLIKMKHPPRVLEIGVDRGVTTIPLVVALASAHEDFFYLGVDVNVQESTTLTLRYLGGGVSRCTFLMQANSLDLLPKLLDQELTFDLVLLDGDHNYHTVSTELGYIGKLMKPDGIIVVDDYDGKWSTRDLWYSEREGYERVQATKPVVTDKQGVKPAVDEWLMANAAWRLYKPIPGEPVILSRQPIP